MKQYDTIIIGGGFFGLAIAEYLSNQLGKSKILVLEKEPDFMQRASYNNQARVHNGYHYPRSLLTALRSRVNFPHFIDDFEQAIVNDFDKYYAVARNFSKVSAQQFKLFCERIEAEIVPAPEARKHFNARLVEDVFKVKEFAFNSDILKSLMLKRLDQGKVTLMTSTRADRIQQQGDQLQLFTKDGRAFQSKHIINCTYSMLNDINKHSKLPLIPLKHELAEMALVKIPDILKDLSVTMMCGPFFSFMPFPSKGLHTLSHVRYTPHSEWHDTDPDSIRDNHSYLDSINPVSHFKQMIADAVRYMPALAGTTQAGSLWEVKTVLPSSESDDSRPILFKPHYGLNNYTCVMGGKLDNIYDVYKELDLLYGRG